MRTGELYSLGAVDGVDVEWIAVREHEDDAFLVLMVPVDDLPMRGTPDVECGWHGMRFARCAQAILVPKPMLAECVGSVPQAVVDEVSRMVRDWRAGCVEPTPSSHLVDEDSGYSSWIATLQKAADALEYHQSNVRVETAVLHDDDEPVHGNCLGR